MPVKQPLWLRKEDVPVLPDGWRALPTSEICEQLKPGKLFEKKTVFESGNIPVLSQGESDFIGFHNEEPGVIATPEEPVVTFANHTCAMRLMKQSFSCIQNIFPKIGKAGICDTAYFYYATQGRVNLSDYKGHHPLFRQAHIPLPPLPIQHKIAAILSAYDELIENNTRRIRILEEMVRLIYREWFVEFCAPGVRLRKATPQEKALTGKDRFPEGWEIRPIGELLSFHIGGGWGKDEFETKHPVEAYVIRGTDIPRAWNLDLSGCPLRYHAESNYKSRALQEEDIVFEVSGGSKDQPLGRSLLVSRNILEKLGNAAICASFCKLLRTNHEIIRAELIYLHILEIYDSRGIMKYQVQSTGLSNFKFEHFLNDELIILPSRAIQNNFNQFFNPLFRLWQTLGSRNSNLRKTRDMLLPEMIDANIYVGA